MKIKKAFAVIADGLFHTYSFYIPAQGLNLKSIKIDNFQLPLEITIKNIQIHSLDLEEIKNLQIRDITVQ